MERITQQTAIGRVRKSDDLFGLGPLDQRTLLAALVGGIGFCLLAIFSHEMSHSNGALATVWLPNAAAVAFMLRARLDNELIFIGAIAIGGAIGNISPGVPVTQALFYSTANIIDIVIVVLLTRHGCSNKVDMQNIDHLARFIWAGGLAGPLASAAFASMAMWPDPAAVWSAATGWFMTDSMGMILIVPTTLLIADALVKTPDESTVSLTERVFLLTCGVGCALMVFNQASFPLLFLIPPITLLHAFRMGSLGTALFVALLAALTMVMTRNGMGPIAQPGYSDDAQMHLLQAFVAANFLTGLPVAAILHGRKRIIRALEEGKRELALLANSTTDALMCFDQRGYCTYASPSVADVLGEPVGTFLGHRPSDRMHEDARERIALAQHRLISGKSDKERFTYRRFRDSDDGTPVFIEAECAAAYNPETGQREGIAVSARDVTERVELELLLTRARRHAENAAAAKSAFLANMSHEIRTPMNGVLGFAELMLDGELDPDQRRHTEMIVQSGRSMMMLLNDVLDLSKIEAGQITIDQRPVDLDATIHECAALHRPTAEKKGLELEVETQSDIPWVMTDGLRLRQILLNLVGNAVKFTEAGRVMVGCQLDGEQFRIHVTDSGIGISKGRIEQVFNPFTQGDSDTDRRFGGTGLGLSISRQLAQLLGGTITVKSEPGVGSQFTLTLPLAVTDPDAQEMADTENFEPDAMPSGSRILLAEDHDVNRMLVTEMLERCGQSVSIAHDGNEAITMVLDSFLRGAPYDLVLMDVQMPGCDGYAATRAIRGEGIMGDDLPIIALTANAFPEDLAAARDAGMQGHLAKPLEFAKLARMLQRWLPTRIVEHGNDIAPKDAAERTLPDRQKPASNDISPAPDRLSTPLDKGSVSDTPSPKKTHSPALLERWEHRRFEAVEATREALETEGFTAGVGEALINKLHKLAGTAGMFGEPELGDKASALEHALRSKMGQDLQRELCRELIDTADRRRETDQLANRA